VHALRAGTNVFFRQGSGHLIAAVAADKHDNLSVNGFA